MFTSHKQYQTGIADLRTKAEVARRCDVVNARIMILSILRKHGLTLADFDGEANPPKPLRIIEKISIRD